MTTDLSKKTVSELSVWAMDWGSYADAFDELARRLKEAQQRNAAHDAKVAAEALEEASELFGHAWTKHVLLRKAAEYRAKATEAGRKE